MAGKCVRITPQMADDAKKLLRLMGCAVIQAPSEGESQACEIVKKGLAYAVCSEDMDCMALAADNQIKGFDLPKGQPVQIINHKEVLDQLNLTQKELVDLCIICGCDFTPCIPGLGPATAYKAI